MILHLVLMLMLMLTLTHTPKNLILTNRFPNGQREEKNDVHLLTSLKREKIKEFLELCSYVQMRADPCLSMAAHRQMVSCKTVWLSCNSSGVNVRQNFEF
jgi:hypothetical protein